MLAGKKYSQQMRVNLRRKIRHNIMNDILVDLKLPQTDEVKDTILIALETHLEDTYY